MLAMGNHCTPPVTRGGGGGGGLDDWLQIQLPGARGNQEAARGTLFLLVSLIYISYNNPLSKGFSPPMRWKTTRVVDL